MGLISSEKNSGTIKLLYSSPIKLRSIVIGKYFAIMTYSLLMMAVMALVAFGANLFIENMDWGIVIPSLLTIFLLIGTYSAIGLFMSSLTRYQVISGIATIALIFVLDYLGGLGQDVPVVKDILYWLSISQHADNAMKGFIISSDILYFVIISVLFLFLTISKMHADRVNSADKLKVWLRVAGSLAVTAVIIYVITLPKLTYQADFTETQRHTLAPEGREILAKLDKEPLKVTMSQNVIGALFLLPERREDYKKRNYSKYIRFAPDMQFNYSFFYGPKRSDWFEGNSAKLSWKEKAKKTAYYQGLDFSKIKSFDDQDDVFMSNYYNKQDLTYGEFHFFEYDGKKSAVNTTLDDPMMGAAPEDYFTALNTLIVPGHNVVFASGHKERSITRAWDTDWGRMANFYLHRSALVRMGFEVSEANLSEADIPANTDILIIADPMVEYKEEALARLKAYIESGGDLIIAGEKENAAVINPLLEQLGVKINTANIQTTFGRIPTPESRIAILNKEAPKDLLVFMDSRGLVMESVAALDVVEDKGFNIIPYLFTNKKTDYLVDENGEQQFGKYALMLAMSRQQNGKEQKVFIAGDADFLSNKEMNKTKRQPFTPNVLCYKNMFKWLSDGDYPLKLERISGTDNKAHISNEKVSVYKVIYIWIIPLLFGLMGAIYLIRRRRM